MQMYKIIVIKNLFIIIYMEVIRGIKERVIT